MDSANKPTGGPLVVVTTYSARVEKFRTDEASLELLHICGNWAHANRWGYRGANPRVSAYNWQKDVCQTTSISNIRHLPFGQAYLDRYFSRNSMLCVSCQDILNAKSDRVCVDGAWGFKYHENIQAFKASAEAGCQLCLMAWYQVSENIPETALEDPTPILYTINEWNRKDGSYEVTGGCKTGDSTAYYHVEFVRSKDHTPLSQTIVESPEIGVVKPSLKLVARWIKDCRSSHEDCVQLRLVQPHKFRRILELGRADGGETIRLVECSEVAVDAEYMTLSHCWGNIEILKLLNDSYERMKGEIALAEICETFRDTIYVVRELGCRYLWIDSLCIIQDSPEDWRSQAAVMGEIYQGSICNIAATAARDGNGGLLTHLRRNPAYTAPLHVHVPDMGQLRFEDIEEEDVGTYDSIYPMEERDWTGMAPGYYDCYDANLWWRGVSDSPLLRRAWVVQERLLAPRVVHFGSHQIFWECNTLKACEVYPDGMRQRGDLEPAPKSKDITLYHPYPVPQASPGEWNDIGPCPQVLRSWGDIVEAYTLGELTFPSDKLVAIEGLASLYADQIKAPYLFGLWGFHLPRQLLWAILRPGDRPKPCRAPSWSWAAVEGQVDRSSFLDTDDLMVERLITILGLPVQTKPTSAQGLRVQGRLIPCSLDFDPDAFFEAGRYNPRVRGLECAAVVMPDATELDDSEKGILPGPFFCVPIAIICEANTPTAPEVAGLVLEPTEFKGTFRRFGAFRTDREVGRDGDSHGDSRMHLVKSGSAQSGRVFLIDVEDELAEVEEEFYESYVTTPERKGGGNFVFQII